MSPTSDMIAVRKPMSSSYETQFFNHLHRFIATLDTAEDKDGARSEAFQLLMSSKEFQLSLKGMDQFRKECVDKLKPAMEKLMLMQDKAWADIWIFVVEHMGIELHSDNKFLNNMLSVLEVGMKRKEIEAMKVSLRCWEVLIDNFSLSPKMMATQRRVALLTIPLKARNVRDAEVAEAKLKVWWRLFLSLGDSADQHAEVATKPFLVYAFGPFDQSASSLMLTRFPSLSKSALMVLTALVATGVADRELELVQSEFKSQTPFINGDKTFLCLAEWVVRSIDVLLQQPAPPPAQPLEILISATFYRINSLFMENSSVALDVLALLLKAIGDSLVPLVLKEEHLQDVLLSTVSAALKTLSMKLLDAKLKNLDSTSTRDCLFKLLCCQKHLLMHAKPAMYKPAERQFLLLEELLISQGARVIQPDCLARIILLKNALIILHHQSTDADIARKCFHLWEQCCRFFPKIPREYSSQEANKLAQKTFLELLMVPFRIIVTSNIIEGESFIAMALKNLFFSYSEIVHLSLSVDKEDPCKQLYKELLGLLEEEDLSPSAFHLIVKVVCRFTPARTSVNYTKFFGKSASHEAEHAELKLLTRLIELLCKLASTDPSTMGKSTPLVAKALSKLVMLVNSSNVVIEAINLFHQIFTHIPVNHWPSNRMEVTDPWTAIVSSFKHIVPESESMLPALEKLKLKLESLVDHRDIKVCNAAKEMLACYSISGDSQSSQESTTPVQRTTASRKRSYLTATQSTPPAVISQITLTPPSQKYSPGKPSLEDLDSQDFVKIPSQPKTKKPLTPHQREVKRRRRDDIPALYQGLSQQVDHSQDTQEDSISFMEPPKVAEVVPFTSSVWDEEAVDIDLTARSTPVEQNDENTLPEQESDENKSMNFQLESVPPSPSAEEELKIKNDSIEEDIVENSQSCTTVTIPMETKPDLEQSVQTLRACNRQGVALPTVKTTKETDSVEEVVVPVSKRKSTPPVRGAGLKNLKGGRAATMLGLVQTKETKHPEAASTPQQVMSSLKLLSVTVVEKHDLSPPVSIAKSDTSLIETPKSSCKKRSNLKKDRTEDSPSPKRSKRVSFAEPVVSGQQDSPKILQDAHVYQGYYQRFSKKLKSSRKLSMMQKSAESDEEETKQLHDYEFFCDNPHIHLLVNCKVPVSSIVGKLTTPELRKELLQRFEERKIKTMNDLNLVSRQGIEDLPILEPKTVTFVNALMDFVEDLSTSPHGGKDEVSPDWKDSPELREKLIEKLGSDDTEPLPKYFDTIPSIDTVTTHENTIAVIEEVITSPEIESPEPIKTAVEEPEPAVSPPIATEEEVEEKTIDEGLSPDLIESSLEPDSLNTKIDVPDESSAVNSEEPPCNSAEELYKMLSESEKEKFRLMFVPEKEEKSASETVKELLNTIPNLESVIVDIEDKLCEALPSSTIEKRVKNLLQTDASFMSDLPARDLLKPLSDNALTEELLRRLQNGIIDSSPGKNFYEGALRSFILDSSSSEELLKRLELNSLIAKLELKDLLVAASERTEELLSNTTASDALEKLAARLPEANLVQLLSEKKNLDEEMALQCIRALMTRTTPDKVVDPLSAVRAVVGDAEKRISILTMLLEKVEDGELMTIFGQKRVTDLMTVGVLSGDIDPQKAINDVFCSGHIVKAASSILRDGASAANQQMLLDAFPRETLATWVAGLISK